MIKTRGLTRTFGGKKAVDQLDLDVQPGEIFGFLGPNGAGKSTTVKMLTGLLAPSSGWARVAGFDIVNEPLEAKRRIGYVPETGALYEHLSPVEYLDLVSALHHLDPAAARLRTEELLELFDLSGARAIRMTEFSKGMKQKVVLSSALITKPEVLFLDEPLNGLDANTAMLVKALLKQMAAQGKTVFFSSHILEVVERICTRIAIIKDGQKAAEGTPEGILASTGTASLEEAFGKLTGIRDAVQSTSDFLAALEKA
jgi:ABC-2 type transport system ATP-binding protein